MELTYEVLCGGFPFHWSSWFPVAAVETMAPAQRLDRPKPQTSAEQRRTILVVDDHRDTLRQKLLLTRLDPRFRGRNMTDALHIAANEEFDILLSDIGLPTAAVWNYPTDPANPNVPALALSGFGMDEDLQRSRDPVSPITSQTVTSISCKCDPGLDLQAAKLRAGSRRRPSIFVLVNLRNAVAQPAGRRLGNGHGIIFDPDLLALFRQVASRCVT